MSHDIQGIVKTFNGVRALRTTFDDEWQSIADFILGRRDFVTTRFPGERRMHLIYDTTAMLSGQLLGAGLHSLLTNTATQWFSMEPEDKRLLENREAALWFEGANETMQAAFQRPEANFSAQMHEAYTDISFFGNGGVYMPADTRGGLLFSAAPIGEIFLQEGPAGRVDTIYRLVRMTAKKAVETWGDRAGEQALKDMESNNQENRIEYLHVVRPRKDRDLRAFGFRSMQLESLYIEMKSKQLVDEGGFRDQPYAFARWSVDPGETYGRGPGQTALPNAMMLNEIRKTIIKNAQKATDPPMLVEDDGVLTQINTTPGSINVVRSIGSKQPPIQYLQNQSRMDLSTALIDQVQADVRGAFHFELLKLIQNRGLTPMTATQVLEIADTTQRLLAPILGRLQVELLEPIIERMFGVLARQGMFPPAPLALQQDQRIAVEYVSPVARAQRQGNVAAIDRTMARAANVAQVAPEALDVIDWDESMRAIAEGEGVPPSTMRDPRVVAQLRQARAQKQAEEEQQAAMVQAGETAAKLGVSLQQQAAA